MTNLLPPQYRWLNKERAPRILLEALRYYGIQEIKGEKHNPEILGWAKIVNPMVAGWYDRDEHPWCALFISYLCKKLGLPVPEGFEAVRARGFATWGNQAPEAMLGDLLIFSRLGGGHVGIYVGEDDRAYHVLGGNQADKVCIIRIAKDRCTAIRRTPWKVGQPPTVRKIHLAATGGLSHNEA